MISANVDTIWGKTVNELKTKLNSQSYETWIMTMKPVSIRNNVFYIIVQDHFSRDWLNNSYAPLFKDIISKIDNSVMDVQFVMQDEIIQDNTEVKYRKAIYELKNTPLNHKYTFDNFVVGDSNRFAHAACLAVADSPAKAYNPLFIYGGVGLGKTHLMHAIGHFISETNKLQVAYVTSEKFTNDLISAIREEKTVEFKEKYRNIDTLLIDDIQFLAGKERTQEEFFHTFNTLYEASKQIIISSDRPPKEIPTLEDRLRSRFEWGLITDIQPPDYETRIAILQKKANMENYNVQDDVITFIADNINSNIRELEGALIRVAAYSSFTNQTIDKATAKEVLKDILPDNKPVEITVQLIQQKVANFFGIKIEDLKSKKRHRAVSLPRQIAMYLCRELTDYSLPKVGDFFGGRDHTTVLHAQDKVAKEIQKDPTFAQTVHKLIENIKQK